MSKAYRLAEMVTALVTPPTATFRWLLAELNETSDSYRVLSIQELNRAADRPADEFLTGMERQYQLPKEWLRLARPERKAVVASYLAEVEKLKRRQRRGDARKGGAHD